MADYQLCIPIVLENEGGLVDNPNDRGGITNYGVSLRFAEGTGDMELFDVDHDGDIDREDIKKLSIEDATEGFKKYFWDKFDLDNESSDAVSLCIFDVAVNHGNKNAANMIQKALVEMGYNIAIDGKVGPRTLAALHSANEEKFIERLLDVRSRFYDRIVERNPSQIVFLKGWKNRIKHLRVAAGELIAVC